MQRSLIGYYHTIGVRTNQLNPTAIDPSTTPDMLFTPHTFNYLTSLGITPHSYRTIKDLNELPEEKRANITQLIRYWEQPTPLGQMKSQEHTILTTALSLAQVVSVSMRTEDFGAQSLQQSILGAPIETSPAFMSPTKMDSTKREDETRSDHCARVALIEREIEEKTEASDAAFEEDQALIQDLPPTTARAVYNHLKALYHLQKKWDILDH